MTYEEALKQLRYEIEEEGHCSFIEDEMKIAFEALEKQIPMQVNLTEVSKVKAVDVEIKEIYTYPVVRCPSCDKPITLYKERKFCEHCGQALDWSEDNA